MTIPLKKHVIIYCNYLFTMHQEICDILDGTRVVKDNIHVEDGDENATLASYNDHYMNRPTTDEFNGMYLSLLGFPM